MPARALEMHHPNHAKRSPSLPGKITYPTSRKLHNQRQVSLSDQNKIHRNPYNTHFTDKDHYLTRTRHTT